MKLTYFSAQTMPKTGGGRDSQPSICFGKSGSVRITPSACTLIGIADGDKVTISQDEDEPLNFYIFKDNQHGFIVRLSSDKKSLIFSHKALCKSLLEAVGRDASTSHRFKVAGKSTVIAGDKAKTQYWGILINS